MSLALWLSAAIVYGTVIPPADRALELPPGCTSLSADHPLLRSILDGAASSAGGPVTHDAAGKTFAVGKTAVTWHDASDGTSRTCFVYLYPRGWQVLGPSSSLRTFEPNAARHVLHDRLGRLHVTYGDGTDVWYRLGLPKSDRVEWQPAIRLNDSPVGTSQARPRSYGATLALTCDAQGNAVVHCAWSTIALGPATVWLRRIEVSRTSTVSPGPVEGVSVGGWAAAASGPARRSILRRAFQPPMYNFVCLATDSRGTLHMVAETPEALVYACSRDGREWSGRKVWRTSETGSYQYRYPSMVIDSRDRVHLVWQTTGYRDNRNWWVPLYTVRDPKTGDWSALDNPLADHPDWKAGRRRQDVLFAYPNLLVDDRDNVHLAWHGTCRSHRFAWDDVFYIMRPCDASSRQYGPWTGYAVVHQRDHLGDGRGEDANFSWVPSLAYKPGSDDLYAMIMFGPADDEVDDAGVNVTDGALKVRRAGRWQPSFQDLTRTRDQRSWYPNLAPEIWIDRDNRAWLDMVWVDGTRNDYNVVFRRVEVTSR